MCAQPILRAGIQLSACFARLPSCIRCMWPHHWSLCSRIFVNNWSCLVSSQILSFLTLFSQECHKKFILDKKLTNFFIQIWKSVHTCPCTNYIPFNSWAKFGRLIILDGQKWHFGQCISCVTNYASLSLTGKCTTAYSWLESIESPPLAQAPDPYCLHWLLLAGSAIAMILFQTMAKRIRKIQFGMYV